jgi:hypothetical protein
MHNIDNMRMQNISFDSDKDMDDLIINGLRDMDGVSERELRERNCELSDDVCCICLDQSYSEHEGLYNSKFVTKCSHIYHRGCIDIWFKASLQNTCPICRTICDTPQCVETRNNHNFDSDIGIAYALHIHSNFDANSILNANSIFDANTNLNNILV